MVVLVMKCGVLFIEWKVCIGEFILLGMVFWVCLNRVVLWEGVDMDVVESNRCCVECCCGKVERYF